MCDARPEQVAIAAALAALLTACPPAHPPACVDDSSSAPVDAGLTFHADVEPIFARRCGGCHQAGGVAPFELRTYEDVLARSGAIRSAVQSRTMPPWQPARCCAEYANSTP
jgi:hypothetical protein